MREDSTNKQTYTCHACHAGNVSIQHVTYYTWLSGELITVPDFPAWICDMCGKREYDQRALSWLNIILNPETGRKQDRSQGRVKPPDPPSIQPDI